MNRVGVTRNCHRTRLMALSAIAQLCFAGCTQDVIAPDEGVTAQTLEADLVTPTDPPPEANAVSTDDDSVASTTQGLVKGNLLPRARAFLGIPYGAPPVGALRFRPAQPAQPWTGIKATNAFGPACVQPSDTLSAPGPQSEDCLTLNVYTPFPKKGIAAPVMVFIHGGSFIAGAGAQYDATKLAELGNVVVTFNYRLGALGFLTLPELDAERGTTPAGNDALRDQQLALAWVQANIRGFGGDPAKVTVFGESAGAIATCVQMVSPLSRTLAKRFILESGTCDSTNSTATLARARSISTMVANAFCAGRSDLLACLRAVPARDLVAFRPSKGLLELEWVPVVNPADPLLPQSPKDALTSGDYNRGELIIGSNARELGFFQRNGTAPTVTSIAQLNAVIDAQFGPLSPLVKQQYTAATDADANSTLVRLGTDLLYRCPARETARRASTQGSSVYLYHFEEGDAFHTYELPSVFGVQFPPIGVIPVVDSVRQYFQTSFSDFADKGVPIRTAPNGLSIVGLPVWPAYATASDRHISIKSNVAAGMGLSKSDCDFLVSVGAVQ